MEYVQYFDFLAKRDNVNLFKQTIRSEQDFVTAGVIDYSNEYTNWRSAKVSFWNTRVEKVSDKLKELISSKYFEVCRMLNIDQLNDYKIDIQLTAHNHGDYFKAHADRSTDDETNNRVLTFVYYFYKIPKPFVGGELVIHGTERYSIDPYNNMIIFFKPEILHEVLPICTDENSFENSRFTLNGWLLKL